MTGLECVWRIAAEVLAAVVLALLFRRFVGAFVLVKGRSMMDTLHNHDLLFALRRGISGAPKRFDVVICHYPGRKGLFVKRVAGLPGECIALEEGTLQIDGAPVEEAFALRRGRRTMPERTLGSGEYFVLGDNRPCSRDSRSIGPIAEHQIVAVARWVVLPPRRARRIR